MLPLPVHGLQELEGGARTRVTVGLGQGVAGGGVLPDAGIGIGVVLAVVQGGGHVEHLPHGGLAEGAAGQLRDGGLHRGVRLEQTLRHQHFAQQPHQ